MPEEKQVKYGGFWIRFLALIIDSIIISIIFSPILSALFPAREMSYQMHIFGEDFSSKYFYDPGANVRNVIFIVYSIVMLNLYGATLGKMLLGLKITGENGKKPELQNIIIRETIGKLISAVVLGLGFLWAAFDPKKQAWHDKLAKTYIVYGKTSLKK